MIRIAKSKSYIYIFICIVLLPTACYTKHKKQRKTTQRDGIQVVQVTDEKKPDEAPPAPHKASQRSVTVHSLVTPEQISIEWCGKHMPDEFSLSVYQEAPDKSGHTSLFVYSAGKETATTPVTVQCVNNRIMVDYTYSFAWGAYKATKRVTYELPDTVDTLQVSFSFTDDQRVLIPNARFVEPITSVS